MAMTQEQLQESHSETQPDPLLLIGKSISGFDPGYRWEIIAFDHTTDEYVLREQRPNEAKCATKPKRKKKHKKHFIDMLKMAETKRKIKENRNA